MYKAVTTMVQTPSASIRYCKHLKSTHVHYTHKHVLWHVWSTTIYLEFENALLSQYNVFYCIGSAHCQCYKCTQYDVQFIGYSQSGL